MSTTTDLDHLEAALRRVEMIKDSEGWSETDGREELFGLRRRANGSLVHRRLELAGRIWAVNPSVPSTVALYGWARRVAALEIPMPSDLVGWAWSMEAFVVVGTTDMPEHEKDQLKTASRNREYYKYPGRKECRTVAGCLITGEELTVIHVLGEGVEALRTERTSGYVPAALRLMCGLEANPEGTVSIDDL